MSEPEISPAIVYELLMQLRTDVREQHQRIRQDMNDAFTRMAAANTSRVEVCQNHHGRLIAVETLIEERKNVSKTQLTVIIAVMSSAVSILWRFLDHLTGWK